MLRKHAGLALAGIGIAALLLTSGALAQEPKTDGMQAAAAEKVLLKQSLKGLEGKEANIVLIEVPAGWQIPPHTHPGNLFVYVLQGTIEIE
jgi:quercetin dioxygenase-like cupin family protein